MRSRANRGLFCSTEVLRLALALGHAQCLAKYPISCFAVQCESDFYAVFQSATSNRDALLCANDSDCSLLLLPTTTATDTATANLRWAVTLGRSLLGPCATMQVGKSLTRFHDDYKLARASSQERLAKIGKQTAEYRTAEVCCVLCVCVCVCFFFLFCFLVLFLQFFLQFVFCANRQALLLANEQNKK